MTVFTKTILFTDTDGRARFRDEPLPLQEGTPQSRLSALFASGGYPVNCTELSVYRRQLRAGAHAVCAGPARRLS